MTEETIPMKAIVVTDQAAGTAGMTLVERPEPPPAINHRQSRLPIPDRPAPGSQDSATIRGADDSPAITPTATRSCHRRVWSASNPELHGRAGRGATTGTAADRLLAMK
jgi:hypothetical protein